MTHPVTHAQRLRPQRVPCAIVMLSCVTVALCGVISPVLAATSSNVEFLYQLAQEYRKAGRLDDAIHELHKALLLAPHDPQTQAALEELESLQWARRQEEINKAIAQIEHEQRTDVQRQLFLQPQPSVPPVFVPGGSTSPVRHVSEPGRARGSAQPPPLLSSSARRVPDPRLNGVQWFYVFGPHGDPDYGALAQTHEMMVDVPTSTVGPVSITVLDADTRGRHDEMAGGWNTTTAFRVRSGSKVLDACTISPDAPDGTRVQFGPFPIEDGELHGDRRRFQVETEGLDGDDNNLYAFEIRPASAECTTPLAAVRLAQEPGAMMRFYPVVPEGATSLVERNYDLDLDGGQIALRPTSVTGRTLRTIPVSGSGSGMWATTPIAVPPGTDGTRWTYQITKATQRKANMAFQLLDEDGHPVPISLTPGGVAPQPVIRTERAPAQVPGQRERVPRGCMTFEFDGSTSSDPDREPLRYQWDFGDGESAEGVRVRHTYAQGGTYLVALTVMDASGTACCQAKATQRLHVNTPPRAVMDVPSHACAGEAVRLSASRSTDTPGEPLRYLWNFGDGTTGEGLNVIHAYVHGGTYAVRLLVDDQQGTPCSRAATTTTLRVNSPPIAAANDAITFCATRPTDSLTVTLNAAGSRDPDRDPLTYSWDFGDGASAQGQRVSHTYARGGRYQATVLVDDGTGTACSIAAVAVPVHVNHAPVAVVSPRVSGCPDEPLRLDATASTDADADPMTYQWDLGDGTTAEGAAIQHRYETGGDFRVTVRIDDGSGLACGTATAHLLADINTPPVAQLTIRPVDGAER